MESSRRHLLKYVAEHSPILKNKQNTDHPRFGFTPKTDTACSKTGFCFYCEELYRLQRRYSLALKFQNLNTYNVINKKPQKYRFLKIIRASLKNFKLD